MSLPAQLAPHTPTPTRQDLDGTPVAEFRAAVSNARRLRWYEVEAGHLLRAAREAGLPGLLDTRVDDGQAVWVEPWCPTRVFDRLHHEGPWAPLRVAQLGIRVALTLQLAHARGICHQTLHPNHLRQDLNGELVVTGWVLVLQEVLTNEYAQSLGCFHPWSAPERSRSSDLQVAAGDVYSLGAILWTLLAGRPPFEAEELGQLLHAKRKGKVPTPVSEIGPIITACLHPKPAQRPDLAAVIDTLRGFTDSLGAASPR